MAIDPKAQLLAKILASILLAGLVFLVGREGLTAATVGELPEGNMAVGIAVIMLSCVSAIALYLKYR